MKTFPDWSNLSFSKIQFGTNKPHIVTHYNSIINVLELTWRRFFTLIVELRMY